MIGHITDREQKRGIAAEILGDLPEWFGLPESTKEYIEESQNLPFRAAEENGKIVGFLALKETSPHTVEIYVMGIRKHYQRGGIGTELFEGAHIYAKEQGYSYMQVKTVQEGHYEEYDRTSAFYKRMGFRELEVFPELWDAWNPCQVYVRAV